MQNAQEIGDMIAIHSLGPIKQQPALGYQRLHRTMLVFTYVRDSSNFYAVQPMAGVKIGK
jgi:hypothetical protein